jgi:hypothetical protein
MKKVDNYVASGDYGAFYAEWYDKISLHVRFKGWFNESDVDDVAQDIIIDFMKGDYLARFDPEKTFIHRKTGKEVKPKFSTFVYAFVNKKLLGKRDKYNKGFWREGLSVEAKVSEDSEMTFLDTIEAVADNYDIEFLDFVDYIKESLLEVPVTTVGNDFPRLFDIIINQIINGVPQKFYNETGHTVDLNRKGLNRHAIAWELNITTSGVAYMLKNLKKLLTDMCIV